MRFMMIVKANAETEAGVMPEEEMLAAMARYNEELVKAGILLDATGLQPTSKGAKIKFKGDQKTVVDGPFTESKELIAGYWVIQVKDKNEAIKWAKRAPNPHGKGKETEIELRQLFELEDFGESEAVEQHRKLENEMKKKH